MRCARLPSTATTRTADALTHHADPSPPALRAGRAVCLPAPPTPTTSCCSACWSKARALSQLGIADSANAGTVGQKELAARTVYRPGEMLEAMPGLIVSQHSGEGKANQFYLRGFNLDHGTDLATYVDGMPVNHAQPCATARARPTSTS